MVATFVLGCNCGKNLDLANLAKNINSNSNGAFGSDDDKDADSELPGEELLVALVKETTADFAYAISSEDFSKIYEKSSTDFQATYTEDQMKDVFKEFVAKKKLIVPILLKANGLEPKFSPDPYTRSEKGLTIMVTDGQYDTKPVPLHFEYEYVKRDGKWKLLKLIVKLI